MKIEMVDPDKLIMQEIADPRCTRDTVAETYAWLIRQMADHEYDFVAINRAILDRWSPSALEYIKRKAWRKFSPPPTEPSE